MDDEKQDKMVQLAALSRSVSCYKTAGADSIVEVCVVQPAQPLMVVDVGAHV
jgi:hypothetical protein